MISGCSNGGGKKERREVINPLLTPKDECQSDLTLIQKTPPGALSVRSDGCYFTSSRVPLGRPVSPAKTSRSSDDSSVCKMSSTCTDDHCQRDHATCSTNLTSRCCSYPMLASHFHHSSQKIEIALVQSLRHSMFSFIADRCCSPQRERFHFAAVVVYGG